MNTVVNVGMTRPGITSPRLASRTKSNAFPEWRIRGANPASNPCVSRFLTNSGPGSSTRATPVNA